MKSSVKNTQNLGLVNWFKNTKLGKWLTKKKLFFIRTVAHSKRSDDIVISYKSGYVYFKDKSLNQEYSIPYDWFKKMFTDFLKDSRTYSVNTDLNKKNTPLSNKSDLYSGALKPNSEFWTPKEVVETLLRVIEKPNIKQSTLANHLMILSVAFSKQHLLNHSKESEFCQDLYHLCQNHISNHQK
ncbi:hypothetical protein MHL31_04230 [Lutibacter sp. A80]|uniref:hypothetical protein n=1 Tax=Lutibacter sp. A80 TaxID=2918453 RepID=UPI001F06A74E|nr:hypothetical protein [Lutibacter sp. A80]UMB61416.1 hypothetical protein MHL31_04230 [Lutibacter sp. A80]